MSKTITVEELAADVRKHIAEVEGGEDLTVTDEGREIATIRAKIVRRGVQYPFRNLNITPLSKKLNFDPADLIIEEREYERSGKKHGF